MDLNFLGWRGCEDWFMGISCEIEPQILDGIIRRMLIDYLFF